MERPTLNSNVGINAQGAPDPGLALHTQKLHIDTQAHTPHPLKCRQIGASQSQQRPFLHFRASSCHHSSIICARVIKLWYIKVHLSPDCNCWTVKCFASITLHAKDRWSRRWAPLGHDAHDIYYPHNHYYFNKISFVFIKARLIVILHD